jgi:predicted metal-dependent hydrolase
VSPEGFKAEVRRIADEVGVEIKEIHLRKMTQKWASCSSRGRLTFDPELLERAREERLEVVLHELLHLRYPNHGKMFRQMLDTYSKQFTKVRLQKTY